MLAAVLQQHQTVAPSGVSEVVGAVWAKVKHAVPRELLVAVKKYLESKIAE